MCGRFIRLSDLSQIQDTFGLDQINTKVVASYNIAPTQEVVTVVRREGQNRLEVMRWGLTPAWTKDANSNTQIINARAESVAEKPSFKRPFKSQRCLIVADGFYEWHKDGEQKIPMFIRLKTKRPFGFAGIYDTWKSPEGQLLTACAIITTTANNLMQPIHNRMPVILPKEVHLQWLDPVEQDLGSLVALLQPYPSEKMEAYQVSHLVNSPRNNSVECIRPVD